MFEPISHSETEVEADEQFCIILMVCQIIIYIAKLLYINVLPNYPSGRKELRLVAAFSDDASFTQLCLIKFNNAKSMVR